MMNPREINRLKRKWLRKQDFDIGSAKGISENQAAELRTWAESMQGKAEYQRELEVAGSRGNTLRDKLIIAIAGGMASVKQPPDEFAENVVTRADWIITRIAKEER